MSSKFVLKSEVDALGPYLDPEKMVQAMGSITKTYKTLHPGLQQFIEFVEVKEHTTDDRHADGRYIAIKIVLSGVIYGRSWKEEKEQQEKPSLVIDSHDKEAMKSVGITFERCIRDRFSELWKQKDGEAGHFLMLAKLQP